MSTAGSVRSGESGVTLSPGSDAASLPPASPVSTRKSSGFFRWSGILALLFFAVVMCAGWMLFADYAIKSSIAEAATKSLGVEVDIDKLHLSLRGTSLDIRGLTVAHPGNAMLNVIDIGHA